MNLSHLENLPIFDDLGNNISDDCQELKILEAIRNIEFLKLRVVLEHVET